jgi:N-acetylglucosamine-6-phosphate deacetylase
MASFAPAQAMELTEHGQLKVGNKANFVLLNQDLRAQACWINGKQITQQP